MGLVRRHGAELDRIFDELVALRTSMAQRLGYGDFVELGYRRMCRVDYDRSDVEHLRAAVREHVVPLAEEIRRRQADTLGVEHLAARDEGVHHPDGDPVPAGDHDWMLARAEEMFDSMGPLGPFFRQMRGGGFLDLADRKGKAGGGFCTSFPTHGMPFVYANFNGTKGDVEVFTHEMGHAFQSFTSRDLPLTGYLWPTYESAEIHSMSLEFLTWPHMERFFGDQAARFRRVHLTEAILFLPYGTAVDHFQHEIYAQPQMSPEARRGAAPAPQGQHPKGGPGCANSLPVCVRFRDVIACYLWTAWKNPVSHTGRGSLTPSSPSCLPASLRSW